MSGSENSVVMWHTTAAPHGRHNVRVSCGAVHIAVTVTPRMDGIGCLADTLDSRNPKPALPHTRSLVTPVSCQLYDPRIL